MTRARRPDPLHHPRSRGYILIEMIVTLAMIALVATMAGHLIFRIFDTSQSLAAGEQAAVAMDRAVTALRRDVRRADTLVAHPDGVEIGGVRWTITDDTLTRATSNQPKQMFGALPTPLTLSATGGEVILRSADAAWAFTPLVETNAGGGR